LLLREGDAAGELNERAVGGRAAGNVKAFPRQAADLTILKRCPALRGDSGAGRQLGRRLVLGHSTPHFEATAVKRRN
jgi:hypothetical protein